MDALFESMSSRIISNGTLSNKSNSNYNNSGLETINYAYPCGREHYYHCAVFIVCSIIFVAGFLGNCVVIGILHWKKAFRKKSTFMSIHLLAISDLMALTMSYWEEMFAGYFVWENLDLNKNECTLYIIAGISPFLLSCFSVTMLAIVRYDAVVHPLKFSRLKRRKFIIILYLAAGTILSIIMAVIGRMSLETMSCYDAIYGNGYIVFIVPPTVIAAIIILLSLHILKIQQFRKSMFVRTYNVKSSIRRMNIMIYVILCIFIVCQTPYIIFDFVEVLEQNEVNITVSEEFTTTLLSIGVVCHLLNHAVNPFVYFISFYVSKQNTSNTSRSSNGIVSTTEQSSKLWGGQTLRMDSHRHHTKTVRLCQMFAGGHRLQIYSWAMKTQHQNIRQYLKEILKKLSIWMSCECMNTKGGHDIDLMILKRKNGNVTRMRTLNSY